MVSNIRPTGTLFEEPQIYIENSKKIQEKREYQWVWTNIGMYIYIHLAALYGFYLLLTTAHFLSCVQVIVLYMAGCFGVTAGAHRLWSHRAYKATWQLKLILVTLQTLTAQIPVIHWAREHRLHHKFCETHADPHNINNGFFFAHVGWALCKKHPLLKEKGKQMDLSDLYADPLLYYQKKYFVPLALTLGMILPTYAAMVLWGETFSNAFHGNMLRYCLMLNATWTINSLSHMIGWKPYDRNVGASDINVVSVFVLGEGSHNFHHTFPWDYRTADLGKYSLNFSTGFIKLFETMGWAYDLKTVSDEIIVKRVKKTGDGSHGYWNWGHGEERHPDDDHIEAEIGQRKINMENDICRCK